MTADRHNAEVIDFLTNFGAAEVPEILRYCRIDYRDLGPMLKRALGQGSVLREGSRYRVPEVQVEAAARQLAGRVFHPHEALRARSPLVEEWLRSLHVLARSRPGEHDEWHQWHVTLRTSLLRALYLQYRGDARGKDVVLLGDSDLTSLAICMVGGYGRLRVLERDPEVIDFLAQALDRLAAKDVEVCPLDARDPLPDELRESADTVMCDPSRRLYRAFFARGVELLRPSGVFYTFVDPSHGEAAGQFILQRDALAAGWIITDSVPLFNEYQRHPGVPSAEFESCYPTPESADDDISFTETMVRFIRSPQEAEEEFIRRTVHDRP
ncbi:bis-aminopropyl spermidine synthase family protein [Streptomyces sp. NPDC001339]|uniref:bis-aminopropyl spermidine synthase family protein n=1 Tax=Streptomyces sp. NPDC001339 TaxID=3364563 RepID=UPI00367F2C69